MVGHDGAVDEWTSFLRRPRDDFAATMTEEERPVWRPHVARLQQLHEEAATASTCAGPAVAGGDASGGLGPLRVSLLCGRDGAAP